MTHEKKRKLSKITKEIVIVLVVSIVLTVGIYGVHSVSLGSSLSANNVMLSTTEVDSLMSNSSSWNEPFLPTGNDVASADYTNGTPIPPFGGNFSSPNAVIIIIKNTSAETALSGYRYLESHLTQIIEDDVSRGTVINVSLSNYSGRYLGFYNYSKNIGLILTVVQNYIIATIVYNLGLNDLIQLFTLQVDKINNAMEYDSTHFILDAVNFMIPGNK